MQFQIIITLNRSHNGGYLSGSTNSTTGDKLAKQKTVQTQNRPPRTGWEVRTPRPKGAHNPSRTLPWPHVAGVPVLFHSGHSNCNHAGDKPSGYKVGIALQWDKWEGGSKIGRAVRRLSIDYCGSSSSCVRAIVWRAYKSQNPL